MMQAIMAINQPVVMQMIRERTGDRGPKLSRAQKLPDWEEEPLILKLYLFNAEVSYQNNDPQESNAYEKLVKVSEDIPLERWDRTQEAAVEVEFILRLSFFFIDGKPEHEKENSGGGESEDGQEEGGEHPNLHLVPQICT